MRLRLLALSAVAWPFYAAGLLAGMTVVSSMWCWDAVRLGYRKWRPGRAG